jgi:hypothetical protein
MLAAGGGHEQIVVFLAGAFERCIDWRNKAGLTAMMHAAQKGWDEVVNVSFIMNTGRGGERGLIGYGRH